MSGLARVEPERRGLECIVRVSGEIDLSNTDWLAEEIGRAVPGDVRRAVIDLSGITYLDSAGVSLLLQVAARLQVRRQELRLRIPRDSPIRATVMVAGLEGAIPIDDA